MTKKDYIKLAQALKDSRPVDVSNIFVKDSPVVMVNEGQLKQWNSTVEHIAQTLQFDNPQFNRARFLHACGYTQEG